MEKKQDPLPHFVIQEAKAHDGTKLPHQYEPEEVEEMFPIITAPERIANDEDWSPDDSSEEWISGGSRRRDQASGRSGRASAGGRADVRAR